jgi:UDP-GlcNAc:undecaprenyl-phosphate GlcNAc-1-phosphate transferase
LAPLYILAVPIIDTVYVMALRIRAGRKIYYGSPDHFPLRLRKRLDGWTEGTVVLSYAVAVIFGAIGLVVLFLDPISTLIVTAVFGVTALGFLVWLAMVPMES